MILIYTTHKNTEAAVNIGDLLIKDKLAACVNIWPIQSIYRDGDEIKSHLEAAMLIKTFEQKLQQIEEVIEKNHPDKTPFIGAVDVRRFNRSYREWMMEVVK
ncbi:MAG: divalent-cation tolerance protein CutA [Candidatus Harrisonbacteria bacterium CG10_big_fil_rev_8_21_14_0_10_49_15]|uniref:Divalent-cation tolerance protein CutA n=1 Tax=Candidatus Harrisonbacteria bacterium CG10_big_fil_rev_8_21_14_0_10_49_15 TaxID=1974587 RepID=A0A2H0UKK2_9BACT|nr:MAG: divalent-cation tolerance protein CutA [Candidatus Harrisonbacteria bacterium CG10_big_fil_rev_8_21_14_0_10_49_15]